MKNDEYRQMNPIFDYQKEFFRRPFWTESNRLFFKFLLGTITLFLPLQMTAIWYFHQLPAQKIQSELKETYFAQFLELTQTEMLTGLETTQGTRPTGSKPETKVTPQGKDENNPVGEGIRLSLEDLLEKLKPAPIDSEINKTIASIINDRAQHMRIITSAIEKALPLIHAEEMPPYSPLESLIRRREASAAHIRAFQKQTQGKIKLKPPEITDFGIIQGYRDYEKTLTIINENSTFIKYCIEKYYRNNPLFKGNFVVKFVIHPEGYVKPESIRIVETNIQNPRVLQCIKKTIRRWRNFPRVAYEMGDYAIVQKYIF